MANVDFYSPIFFKPDPFIVGQTAALELPKITVEWRKTMRGKPIQTNFNFGELEQPGQVGQIAEPELPKVIVDGPFQFELNKRKFRIIFENETEDSVDILVIPKSDKPIGNV
jgi:hypothetical protein